MLLLSLLLACGDKDTSTDDSAATDDSAPTDDSASTDDSGVDDTEDTGVSPDAPTITSCDAFCYEHQTGETFINWRVECNATDPQGVENVWSGSVQVTQGGGQVFAEKVACDGAGFCTTTFAQDTSGVICEQASNYTFIVRMKDWDGNESAPYSTPGAPTMSDRPPCAGLWATPMVHVDGDVTVCCLDEHLENRIGNLRETPLAELWNGDLINGWREAHVEGRFEESGPLCTRCNWRSAGAAPDETVERWLEKRGDAARLKRWRERGR